MNKKVISNEDENEVDDLYVKVLLESDDDIGVCYRTMAKLIDHTFIMTIEDVTSAQVMTATLKSYHDKVDINKYFVYDHLRDTVLSDVNANVLLRVYMMCLSNIFIPRMCSIFRTNYHGLIDTLNPYILSPLDNDPKLTALSDALAMEYKTDVSNAESLLKGNPLLLTVYFFRQAFLLSNVGSKTINIT